MSAKIASPSTTAVIAESVGTQLAGRLSLSGSVASLVFLAALHVLSPEFDPAWRMVSEYALGNFGWVLTLMFFTWALGCVGLFFAIRPQVRTLGGKIGLGFLLISAAGMVMGGLFDVNHDLHGLAAMIGIPNLPIAAVLLSVSLSRNSDWTPARGLLLGTAGLTWVSLVLMNVAVFTSFSPSTGEIDPDSLVGWANRFLIVAYDVWLMAVAWRAVNRIRSRSA